MIDAIWQFFLGIGDIWHTILMGVIAFIETLFPPFPGDVLYIALSGLGASRDIPLIWLWFSGFAGCLVSTFLLDSMGRSSKLEKMESLIIKASGKNGFERAKRLLARYGVWMLILSRFIPGIRSILVVVAASVGMKRTSVITYSSVSIVMWYTLMVAAGVVLGAELDRATSFMTELTAALLMVSLAALIIGGIVIVTRMRKT